MRNLRKVVTKMYASALKHCTILSKSVCILKCYISKQDGDIGWFDFAKATFGLLPSPFEMSLSIRERSRISSRAAGSREHRGEREC